MKKMKLFTFALAALLLTSCSTVYKSAVILTQAEDAVMKEWARAHNDHLTSKELDLKVLAAHARFNEAKQVAAVALRAYEAGGQKSAFLAALEGARAAVGPILELLAPVVAPARIKALELNVAQATQL